MPPLALLPVISAIAGFFLCRGARLMAPFGLWLSVAHASVPKSVPLKTPDEPIPAGFDLSVHALTAAYPIGAVRPVGRRINPVSLLFGSLGLPISPGFGCLFVSS